MDNLDAKPLTTALGEEVVQYNLPHGSKFVVSPQNSPKAPKGAKAIWVNGQKEVAPPSFDRLENPADATLEPRRSHDSEKSRQLVQGFHADRHPAFPEGDGKKASPPSIDKKMENRANATLEPRRAPGSETSPKLVQGFHASRHPAFPEGDSP